ncbi:MAG: Flp family type IVb pilin [bacterium]|jgi:pilus assembly protein Flp/PilA
MTILLRRLRRDEDGQGMVEYAMIILLMALAVLTGLTLLGGGTNDFFANLDLAQYL